MDFEACVKPKFCGGDDDDGNLHVKYLTSDVMEPVFCDDDFDLKDDDDDVLLSTRIPRIASLGKCSNKRDVFVKRLFDDSDSLHFKVKKSKVSMYDDHDKGEDDIHLSDKIVRPVKSSDKSFSSLKKDLALLEKLFEEGKRKTRVEEKRLQSIKREIEECCKELENNNKKVSCVKEAHSKMQGKIEECIKDFVVKEGKLYLMEDLIGERTQELKTKEIVLNQVKGNISKEIELRQVIDKIDKECGRKEGELKALSQKIAECTLELKAKEKDLHEMNKLIGGQTEKFESEKKKLLQVMSIMKDDHAQMKVFESMKMRFEGQIKEFESKEKRYESRVKELESDKKHFKIQVEKVISKVKQMKERVRELESKERLFDGRLKEFKSQEDEFEGRVKKFESKEYEFEGRVKELESEKKHFTSQAMELESKENQFDRKMKEVKSKEKELEGRLKDIKSREEEIECQVKDIKLKEEELEGRVMELESKEDEFEGRVKVFESTKKQLEGKVKAMESIKKQFERRFNELESKENILVGRVKEFESKKKEFELPLKELVKKLESKQKHFNNGMEVLESIEQLEGKVLESKERELEDHVKDLKSKEEDLEGRVKDIKLKEEELDGRVKEFESNKKHFESQFQNFKSKEKQFEGLWKELELKENKFKLKVKELTLKEKQFGGQVNDLESKANKIDRQLKETKLTEKQYEILSKYIVEEKDSGLQLDKCEKIDGVESLCSDVLVNLLESSDPAKLVLDIILNPTIPLCDWKGDNVVIINDSRINLLEQLMRISPNIKPCVREEALKLALDLKANMKENTENSLAILGFLLLLSIYGLVTSFIEDEILELFAFVAHHRIAVELFRTLGFANKVSDFVENLIKKKEFVGAVRFSCEYNLADKNQLVDLLQEHVRNAKQICETSCQNNNSNEIKITA
ncbi:uncharacterized protein LOC127086982 isoform X2 [Lathyrus oleraceus]|uniref:uncharacterized protein LOC127086982 isoform X2 n=1 Tax=Pisum sativum TaxID=3888 RepID=UPI0021CF44B4|nr:uncharacterized protein LOC127086982 isoform X2 [Pisum sativum]